MRVVFVLAGLGAGGAEKIVNLLAHHRAAAGDSVHVIALNAMDISSYFPYDITIDVEGLGRTGYLSHRLATVERALNLRKRLDALRPNLVISFLTKVNVIVTLATAGSGIATIVSERNNFDVQQMNPFWCWTRPVAARAATGIVMQTEKARARLPVRLRERAAVIPNPVTSRPILTPRPDAGDRIIAAGRLDRQKGFDLLIDAFAVVAEQIPWASLTIYGEGPERPALEKQASDLGLDGAVHLPGVTGSPGEWLSAGDVFVLSSRYEGFPNVLLEALSGGMAAVSFDCPWGPSEILEDESSGLLVPAGDSQALAAAIARVLCDRQLRKTLCQAGPRATERYSVASILGKWDAVIAQATSGQSSSTGTGLT